MRRRAVHDEQKEERRQSILDTAWRLFQGTSYHALTMAEVAEAAGLAKGTVFLYFKTKEALFLAVLEQQLETWFAAVDAGLGKIEGSDRISQVIALLSRQLEIRPGLTRLLAILHTVLEQNISHAEARQFKYMLKEHFERTGAILERCLPFLRTGEGAHLLLQCDALIIGLWQLADPAPVVKQVLQEPALQLFELRFTNEFAAALHVLLHGLQRTAQLRTQDMQEEKENK